MNQLVILVRRLVFRDQGQDLMEYGVLVALIAVVAVGAVTTLGNVINTVFWETIAAASF